MDKAKYKIPEKWKDVYPGHGCKCGAGSQAECGCGADWTPSEVYELREFNENVVEEIYGPEHVESWRKINGK